MISRLCKNWPRFWHSAPLNMTALTVTTAKAQGTLIMFIIPSRYALLFIAKIVTEGLHKANYN